MSKPLRIGVIDDAADENMIRVLLPDSGISLSAVLLGAHMTANHRIINKVEILDMFRKRFAPSYGQLYTEQLCGSRNESDDPVPILLCRYTREQQMKMMDAFKRLQDLFEKQDCACAVICDCIGFSRVGLAM